MIDIHPELSLHYHNHRDGINTSTTAPVEKIIGNGNGWTKEVNGNVQINPVAGRTTVYLEGAGAMKINGNLRIG